MNFNIDRDLVFFDIEATGADVVRDRIMQIAMIKYLIFISTIFNAL